MTKKLFFLYSLLFTQMFYGQAFFDMYYKSSGVEGGILIYEEKKDQWIFNNEFEIKKLTAPGATFHIIHALIGLEKNVISTSESDKKTWDGIPYYFQNKRRKDWEQDSSLSMALRYQNDAYFESLSLDISKEEYEYYLTLCEYSNVQINKSIPYFWQHSELKTNAEHQVLLLKALYKKELPFAKSHQQFILNQLLLHQDEVYTLYAYPASTTYDGSYWEHWIGIVENKRGVFYFTNRIRKSVEDDLEKDIYRLKYTITAQILESLRLL